MKNSTPEKGYPRGQGIKAFIDHFTDANGILLGAARLSDILQHYARGLTLSRILSNVGTPSQSLHQWIMIPGSQLIMKMD